MKPPGRSSAATLGRRNMNRALIKLAVSGFNDKEGSEGVSAILEEFRHRPWILNPKVNWDKTKSLLMISMEYEANDLNDAEKTAQDEIWDCVIACIDFSGEQIHFEKLESKLL
jgi:hypothetical protein